MYANFKLIRHMTVLNSSTNVPNSTSTNTKIQNDRKKGITVTNDRTIIY